MSGSGHHDSQPSHALGGKIKDEVLSALKLLFKNAEQHSVSLLIDPQLTIYPTELPVDSINISLHAPEPEVSEDPIRALQERDFQSQPVELLKEAPMADASPCDMAPTLCHEPVYDEMTFDSIGISFDNMAVASNRQWPIQPMQTKAAQKPITGLSAPAIRTKASGPIHAKSRSALDKLSKVAIKSDPRFYALPIRKNAIPPHRFSLTTREQFRKALAEKAKTSLANVQLKVVFERMYMALYASIQPDELGHYMCIPKSELLGRNRETPSSQALLNHQSAGTHATYLVIGIRLDNKEDIRTLVPVHTILADTSAAGD